MESITTYKTNTDDTIAYFCDYLAQFREARPTEKPVLVVFGLHEQTSREFGNDLVQALQDRRGLHASSSDWDEIQRNMHGEPPGRDVIIFVLPPHMTVLVPDPSDQRAVDEFLRSGQQAFGMTAYVVVPPAVSPDDTVH